MSSPDWVASSHALLPLDGMQLDPQTLAPEAERAIAELLAQGSSPNTDRSYRAALRYWAAWYRLRYGAVIALPVPPAVVLQFIVDHALRAGGEDNELVTEMPDPVDQVLVQAGFKGKPGAPALATLLHRISVLSKAHQAREVENPCVAPAVRELLARTRRAYAARGALRPAGKPALTLDPLEQLLATCDGTLRGLRDRALLLFAWSSGGRQRSEVSQAVFERLHAEADGGYLYELGLTKTNQEGTPRPEDFKPITGPAADALRSWLTAAKITAGPLFRRIRSDAHVAEGLSDKSVRRIVEARCKAAGVKADFSAHSLRSGFVTEASNQGVALADIMAMTGHTSAATVLRYHRRAKAKDNPGASLLQKLD